MGQNKWDLIHNEITHAKAVSNTYHVFELLWTPDRLITSIDNEVNIILSVDMKSQSMWEKGGFNPNLNNPCREINQTILHCLFRILKLHSWRHK